MFKVNGLSVATKKQLNAMRLGYWNGSDANRIATRSEAVTMLARGK